MKLAVAAIKLLIHHNAKHRRGYRINDQLDDFVLGRAIQEIEELRDSPNDIMEMADAMSILIHYCIRKGWTEEQIEENILIKLEERFNVDQPEKVSDPEGTSGQGETGEGSRLGITWDD